MKKTFPFILLSIILIMGGMFVGSCKKDDGPIIPELEGCKAKIYTTATLDQYGFFYVNAGDTVKFWVKLPDGVEAAIEWHWDADYFNLIESVGDTVTLYARSYGANQGITPIGVGIRTENDGRHPIIRGYIR